MEERKTTFTSKYVDGVLIIDRDYMKHLEEEKQNRPADYYDVIDAIYDMPAVDLDWWMHEDTFNENNEI